MPSVYIELLMQIDKDKDRDEGIGKFIKLMKSLTQYFSLNKGYFSKTTVTNKQFTLVLTRKK